MIMLIRIFHLYVQYDYTANINNLNKDHDKQ